MNTNSHISGPETERYGLQGELFTKRDAAAYFKVSTRTIENWVTEGRLAVLKIGKVVRFPKRALIEAAESHTVNARTGKAS